MLSVPPGSLFVRVTGHGAALVLLHGANMDNRQWDELIGPLSTRHEVIRLDLRNFGKSSRAVGRAFDSVRDLHDVLDSLHIARASLVGLSLGGRVAVDFAIRYPARVDRLVLAAPGLGGFVWSHQREQWTRPMTVAIRAGDSLLAAKLWLGSAYMQPAMARSEIAARIERWTIENAHAFMDTLSRDAPLDPPAIARLETIQAKTLILVGARDIRDIWAITDTLVARLCCARRVSIPEVGHVVNLEAPSVFLREVLAFVPE